MLMLAADGNANRSTHPPFPLPGSAIGPDDKHFCLGHLAKGTFCAIYKCVDLSNSYDALMSGADEDTKKVVERKQRLVAAKVELANFIDSGVIDGEASVLKYFYASVPTGMVPTHLWTLVKTRLRWQRGRRKRDPTTGEEINELAKGHYIV